MARQDVRIEGLAGLAATLKRLPPELASNRGGPLKKAVFAAAKVIREEAKARAPLHAGPPLKKGTQPSGTLKKNIVVKRDRQPERGGLTERYFVTVRKGKRKNGGDAFYARWVEFGHAIVPRGPSKGGSRITDRRRAANKAGGQVAPHPFLRPAYETKKVDALLAFKKTLAKGVAAAVKKARTGQA